MKSGDLVKRASAWIEWTKHNSWLTVDEETEIGIIVDLKWKPRFELVVHWPSCGISWEDEKDLELI